MVTFIGVSFTAYATSYVYYFLTSCGNEITHVSDTPLSDMQIVELSDTYEEIYCGGQAPGWSELG